MSVFQCVECRRQIAEDAPFCPNCGTQDAGKRARNAAVGQGNSGHPEEISDKGIVNNVPSPRPKLSRLRIAIIVSGSIVALWLLIEACFMIWYCFATVEWKNTINGNCRDANSTWTDDKGNHGFVQQGYCLCLVTWTDRIQIPIYLNSKKNIHLSVEFLQKNHRPAFGKAFIQKKEEFEKHIIEVNNRGLEGYVIRATHFVVKDGSRGSFDGMLSAGNYVFVVEGELWGKVGATIEITIDGRPFTYAFRPLDP